MKKESTNQEGLDKSLESKTYRPWAERNGFAHWALALLWIVMAFFLFQITALIISVLLIYLKAEISGNPADMVNLLGEHLGLVFIGNSTGQILFLGLGTWFWSRLHTSQKERKQFLRFNIHSDTSSKIALATLLMLAIQPTIWFLSWLNTFIPVPDMFNNLQNTQMEMIEKYLTSDHFMLLTLFHIAVVPAICEETLYRGYVMRAFQKSWGIWPAIVISGLFFGLYHLQLGNLIPLAALGILFAFLTWVSESIYPAIVAHFINNGGSMMVGTYYPESAFAEITPETVPPVWAVVLSIVISGYIIYLMYNRRALVNY